MKREYDAECVIVITPFQEWRGSYEREKAKALAKHLRQLAEIVGSAATVDICRKAPERPWVSVQEWVGNLREGQWQSDVEIVRLP